jgi:hypothetical protein
MHTLVKFALLAQPVSTAGGLPTPSLSPSTYRHWRYLVWRHSLYERWMANRLNRLAASNNRLVVSTPTLPVPAWVMADAMRVHVCEEPSWFVHGYRSSGGLGWMNATWDQFKAPSFPANMGDATIEQQAWAMWRFANTYGWPDQSGYCHGY